MNDDVETAAFGSWLRRDQLDQVAQGQSGFGGGMRITWDWHLASWLSISNACRRSNSACATLRSVSVLWIEAPNPLSLHTMRAWRSTGLVPTALAPTVWIPDASRREVARHLDHGRPAVALGRHGWPRLVVEEQDPDLRGGRPTIEARSRARVDDVLDGHRGHSVVSALLARRRGLRAYVRSTCLGAPSDPVADAAGSSFPPRSAGGCKRIDRDGPPTGVTVPALRPTRGYRGDHSCSAP